MNSFWSTILWRQFGAAIDDLGNTLVACPDHLWCTPVRDLPGERPEFSEFWYIAYHALFWLDLYLTGSEEGFVPPAPFTLIEQDMHGPLPDRAYTKAELLAYLEQCRTKCQATILTLTDDAAQRPCRFGWGEVSFAELLLYTMRHVQGHTAQLQLYLTQTTGYIPEWVAWAGAQR